MEIIARSSFVKISPRKVRLVVNAIKHLGPDEALNALNIMGQAASRDIAKTLKSAIANAIGNFKIARDDLIIKSITVGEGGSFKRFHPVARGRTHPYKKRMSHIRIVLEEKNGKKG